MATPKTVAFYTLGCKLNYSETSSIGRLFAKAGYVEVDFEQGADINVINTCSVTDFADQKCRNIVRRAMRFNPEAKVVVVGCYAQLKPQEIANIPGVDLILGAAEKFRILEYIDGLEKAPGKGMVQAGEIKAVKEFEQAFSFGDRTRSFLKVQDGCDYKCSFCTIPLARGASRSDSIDNVVSNAKAIADAGVKEIVLTGVNIGDFRAPDSFVVLNHEVQQPTFLDLIKELDKVEGIERYRISSIEPNLCSNEIIDFVAGSRRFAPHFHMPLQSGNDKQLRQMRRRYTRDLYADRVRYIKSLMPHCCIGVDIIVGFPGETEEDFLETYKFVNELDVSYLHVFTYSERPNTLAASMEGSVPMQERRRRNEMFNLLSEKKRRYFYEQHLGQVRPVLFEKHKDVDKLSGFTDNYIRIETKYREEEWVNRVMDAQLLEIGKNGQVEIEVINSLIHA